jgi:hypothetical protein
MKMSSSFNAIEDLDAANLDHAVATCWIEPRSFGVEDDFAHG